MESLTGKITKDDFSVYFKEVTPLQENEKKERNKETFMTTEDMATNDEISYQNMRSLLKNSGIDEKELTRIDIERREKRRELGILSTEEIIETVEEYHVIEMKEKAEEIRQKGICENFLAVNDPGSVLSGLIDENGDYNVMIIDPAYDAFQGYKSEYIGTGLSLEIYKKFGLYGKKTQNREYQARECFI